MAANTNKLTELENSAIRLLAQIRTMKPQRKPKLSKPQRELIAAETRNRNLLKYSK